MFFCRFFNSRIFISQKNMQNKGPYAASLIFIGVMLIIFEIVNYAYGSMYFLTFFVGLQNGIHIKYKGITVRTSHITGYLTDGGFSLGMFLKGDVKAIKKTIFFSISMIVFIIGGISSYLIIEIFKKPLIIYGILYIFSGVYYTAAID